MAAAVVGYVATTAQTPQYKYLASVSAHKDGQSTSYNDWNVAKDSIIVVVAGGGLAACLDGTFGACAMATPSLNAIINGALQDPISTVEASFLFTNSGNGSAKNVDYGVALYSDGSLIQTTYYEIPSLAAGAQMTVTYSHVTTFSELPVSIWNAIQGKGNFDIELVDLTYQGGTTN